jgi:cytosine/uracil/thiamine/allantoin permease
MTRFLRPLLRQAAAFARRNLCTMPMRIAIIVGIVVASASSSHAGQAQQSPIAPAARHFIMLEHAAWFKTTRETPLR